MQTGLGPPRFEPHIKAVCHESLPVLSLQKGRAVWCLGEFHRQFRVNRNVEGGAVTRCESVRRNLGRYAADLLVLLVLDGLPVSRIAAIYGKSRHNVAGAVSLLLDQLSGYYDTTPAPQT